MFRGHNRLYGENTTKETATRRHYIPTSLMHKAEQQALHMQNGPLQGWKLLNMDMRCPVFINLHSSCLYEKSEYFIQIKRWL